MREDPAERRRYRQAMREIEQLLEAGPANSPLVGSQLLWLAEQVVVSESDRRRPAIGPRSPVPGSSLNRGPANPMTHPFPLSEEDRRPRRPGELAAAIAELRRRERQHQRYCRLSLGMLAYHIAVCATFLLACRPLVDRWGRLFPLAACGHWALLLGARWWVCRQRWWQERETKEGRHVVV